MLTFRKALMKDLSHIMRIIHEAQAYIRTQGFDQWQDGYPEEELLKQDIEIGQAYVYADENDNAVSVAIFCADPEPLYNDLEGEWLCSGEYLTIHRMAVDDAHRGSSIASGMLAKAVEMAKANGFISVRSDTHQENKPMRRFLEKNGFKYCGIVYYYELKGDPARVAYELLLK